MAQPTGSPNLDPSFESGLQKLYQEEQASRSTNTNAQKSSLDNLGSTYKNAPSSVSKNHRASEIPSEGEAGKTSGVWNKLKSLIAPKNEYEIEASQQEMNDTDAVSRELFKSMSDRSDANVPSKDKNFSIVKDNTSKVFYTAATGVAKLFQSAKQKFSELKDIFNGLDSTSHIPKDFKPVMPETKEALAETKEEVKEVKDEDHRDVIRTNAQREAQKAWEEVQKENLQKPSKESYENYKNELEKLERSISEPSLSDEERRQYDEFTKDVLDKIAKFHSEDEEKIKNGESLQSRKDQFIGLLNEYKQKVDEFKQIKSILSNFQNKVDDFQPKITQALERANDSEKEQIQSHLNTFNNAYDEVKNNWDTDKIRNLATVVSNLEKSVNDVLNRK